MGISYKGQQEKQPQYLRVCYRYCTGRLNIPWNQLNNKVVKILLVNLIKFVANENIFYSRNRYLRLKCLKGRAKHRKRIEQNVLHFLNQFVLSCQTLVLPCSNMQVCMLCVCMLCVRVYVVCMGVCCVYLCTLCVCMDVVCMCCVYVLYVCVECLCCHVKHQFYLLNMKVIVQLVPIQRCFRLKFSYNIGRESF